MSHYRHRADTTTKDIVEFVQSVGGQAFYVNSPTVGFPDLLVAFNGRTILWEIKTKTGVLSKAQIEFAVCFKGDEVREIRSVRDAASALGIEITS